MEPPVLDTDHLAEVESLESVRPGLREQMLELFTASARTSMAACRSTWGADDPEGLALGAHHLKGNAATLGAIRLRMLAADLERDAREMHGEPVGIDRLDALEATLDETIAAYRRWLEAE